MADVAEIVKEVQPVEKEAEKEKVVEKKVIDLEEEDDKSNEETPEPVKENGESEKNGKAETNGSNGVSTEVGSTKRKSGATDATDGVVEGTPEKKAKVVEVESEESSSTNGSAEVTA